MKTPLNKYNMQTPLNKNAKPFKPKDNIKIGATYNYIEIS